MIMRIFLIITICLSISCNASQNKESVPPESKESTPPTGWTHINECGIEFYIPPSLKEQTFQPEDSCAKEYASENIRLMLDVYGGTFEDKKFYRSKEYSREKDFKLEKINLDEQPAEIITYTWNRKKLDSFKNKTGLENGAVLEVPEKNLTMWADSKSPEDRENAIKIFKTVRFLKK